jgi:hypothetical protein
LALSRVARAVLPLMAASLPSVASCRAATQSKKQATKTWPSRAANTRVKASCDGVPLGRSRYFSNHTRLLAPNLAMATQSLAPLTTAHRAMNTMFSRSCRWLRCTRGSVKGVKGARIVVKGDCDMPILLHETGNFQENHSQLPCP